MKIFTQTENSHQCEFTIGKIVHVETDNLGNFYCCRCKKPLLPTQVADKWVKDSGAKR